MSIRQECIQWICRVQSATSDQVDFLPKECPDYLVNAITAHGAAEQAANDFMMDCGIEHTAVTVKVEMWRAADEKIQGVRPDVYGNATIHNEPKDVGCHLSTRLAAEGAIRRLCGAISRNQQIQKIDQFRGIRLQRIAARTILGSKRLIDGAWSIRYLARAVQITRIYYRNLQLGVRSGDEVTGNNFEDCGIRRPGLTDGLERGSRLKGFEVLCEVVGGDEGQNVGLEPFNIGEVEDPSLAASGEGGHVLEADLQRGMPDVVKMQVAGDSPAPKADKPELISPGLVPPAGSCDEFEPSLTCLP